MIHYIIVITQCLIYDLFISLFLAYIPTYFYQIYHYFYIHLEFNTAFRRNAKIKCYWTEICMNLVINF